jgi:hypothetical protein
MVQSTATCVIVTERRLSAASDCLLEFDECYNESRAMAIVLEARGNSRNLQQQIEKCSAKEALPCTKGDTWF